MVSPAASLHLVRALTELYEGAEARTLESVAKYAARGLDEPDYLKRRLADVRKLEAELRKVVAELNGHGPDEVAKAILAAHELGKSDAVKELQRAGITESLSTFQTEASLRAMVALSTKVATDLQATHLRILRQAADAYRSIVAEAAGQSLAGSMTIRQAAQAALDRFADRGITGYVDAAGRSWDLVSYAEMSMRSATGQACVQGALDYYAGNDQDLVIVSDSPEECEMCRPFEGQVLSISGSDPNYTSVDDATGEGLFHPNCVAGKTLVSGPPVVAASSRRYEGEVVLITCAGCDELTVTPNHPILTPKGWVAAGSLNEGDHVIRYLGDQRVMQGIDPDDEQVPATIEQVAAALLQSGSVPAMRMPVSPEDFHGDGFGGEVDVVFSDGFLWDCAKAANAQVVGKQRLRSGHAVKPPFPGYRPLAEFIMGPLLSTDGIMRSSSHACAALICKPRGAPLGGVGARDRDAAKMDPSPHASLTDAEELGEFILCRSSDISLNEIVHVGRRQFSGHVYNLQTEDGWFACNTIITHNCTHDLGLYTPGLTRPMSGTENPDGYADRQQQRYLERGIRQWKKRGAVATCDPQAALKAQAKVREWQARLRQHIDKTGMVRLRYREQIGKAI